MKIYPWQHLIWQRLCLINQQKRLPHALLLTGQAGMGKVHFARCFAQLLLCSQPKNSETSKSLLPCGYCQNCHLVQCGHHPDIFEITPLENNKAIKIEQIRFLNEKLFQSSHGGGYKIALIFPANQLSFAAANAFLKTLEEPIGQTLFFLIADRPATLPATILSRCQQITFYLDNQDGAIQWLKEQLPHYDDSQRELLLILANQSPLQAKQLALCNYLTLRNQLLQHLLQMHQQPILSLSIVEWLKKFDESLILYTLMTVVMDLLRLNYSVNPEIIYNRDCYPQLLALSQKIPIKNWLNFLTVLNQLNEKSVLQANLNWQLGLENLLLRWEDITRKP